MKNRSFNDASLAYLYIKRYEDLTPEVRESRISTIPVYVLTADDRGTLVVSPVKLAESGLYSGHAVEVPRNAWWLVSEEEWDLLQYDNSYREEYKEKFRVVDEIFEDFINGRDNTIAGKSIFQI